MNLFPSSKLNGHCKIGKTEYVKLGRVTLPVTFNPFAHTMNKNTINAFLLGAITGFATLYAINTLVVERYFQFPEPDSEVRQVPEFIVRDLQQSLSEARGQVKTLEGEIGALQKELSSKLDEEDEEPRFTIHGEDRTAQYEDLLNRQKVDRINREVRDLTHALALTRMQQSWFREQMDLILNKRGATPYEPIDFSQGSDLRRNAEQILNEKQQEDLEAYVREKERETMESRVQAWMLQLESIVSLTEKQRNHARERFNEIARDSAKTTENKDNKGSFEAYDFVRMESLWGALKDILTPEQQEKYRDTMKPGSHSRIIEETKAVESSRDKSN